jgi:hypothetical protein
MTTVEETSMTSNWTKHLRGDPIPWLLEKENPSVRYFTLRDLLHQPEDDPEVVLSQSAIITSRPVRQILDAQYPQGYWVKPDRGYSPKYRATVWQVMFLADLGATPDDAIRRGCQVVLDYSFLPEEGLFSATKTETGMLPCLNGNLLRALCCLGYGQDRRVQTAAQNLAERMLEEEFKCRANSSSRAKRETWGPCAWGAIKTLKAYAMMPPGERPQAVRQAMASGVELLLSRDPAVADYPSGTGKISPMWFSLGFPLGYHSDLLETVDVLAQLGHGGDERLRRAIDVLLSKQDDQGRWPLERALGGTWTSFGSQGKPSKWVTLRVMRMLSRLP